MMCRGNPSNVADPALPASTMVVTPACTPARSGWTPFRVKPSKTCAWRSMRPGAMILPATSSVRADSTAGIFAAMRAMTPPCTATSWMPPSLEEGSTTVPPLSKRSYMSISRWCPVHDEIPEQAGARNHGVRVLGEEEPRSHHDVGFPAEALEVARPVSVALGDRRPRVLRPVPFGGGPGEREDRAHHAHEIAWRPLIRMPWIPPGERGEGHPNLHWSDAGHLVAVRVYGRDECHERRPDLGRQRGDSAALDPSA